MLKRYSSLRGSRLGAPPNALLAALVLLGSCLGAQAEDAARVEASQTALVKAAAFMKSIASHGGYVSRYSAVDLTQRAGESVSPPSVIWMQAPGTGSVGMAMLRIYRAIGDAEALEAAREAAEALGKCQLPSGGWHYSASFDPALPPNVDNQPDYKGAKDLLLAPGQPLYPLHVIRTTFDDDNTQNTVRFLIDYVATTQDSKDPRDEAIRQTLRRALDGMLKAQYPNGAWPERYDGSPRNPADFPVKPANTDGQWTKQWPREHEGDYTGYYTLNDGCIPTCIRTMLYGWQRLGLKDCLASARRGGDFLILAQFPAPQSGWAQEYDYNMEPAWARSFEPPGIVTAESRMAMEALLELYVATGEEKYLQPIPLCLDWLKRSTVGPDLWARLYEEGTNRPIYGGKGGVVYYSLDDLIAKQGKGGYGWQKDFHIPEFIARYEQLKQMGREEYAKSLESKPDAARLAKHAAKVDACLASLDDKGRWLTQARLDDEKKTPLLDQVIDSAIFERNVNTLCGYLEAVKGISATGH